MSSDDGSPPCNPFRAFWKVLKLCNDTILKLLSTRPPKTDEWVGSTGARAAAAALAGLAQDVAQTRPREARATPGFRVSRTQSGFQCRVQDVRFQVQGLGLRFSGFGCWVLCPSFGYTHVLSEGAGGRKSLEQLQAQTRPRQARGTPGTDQSLLSGPSTLKQNRARFHQVVET